MGIAGTGVLFFAWNLGVIFLGILNFKILRFRRKKIFFFKFKFQGFIEKCVGCFLVYLFLGGFFWLKSVKKCVCVLVLKITLLFVKIYFLSVKKGMSELRGFFAWDLGATFLSIPSFKILRFRKKFFFQI